MIIWWQYRYLSTHADPCSGRQAYVAMGPPKALKLPRSCYCVGCLVTLEKISHCDLFRYPSVATRMGLGDHLVKIRVLERPWGPT